MPSTRPKPADSEKKPEIYDGWFDASNAKARKGTKLGWLNTIHYMAPANLAGGETVCPWADRCIAPCLNVSGRGGAPSVKKGRKARALLFQGLEFRDGSIVRVMGKAEAMAAYIDTHRKAIDGTGSTTKKHLLAVAAAYGLKPVLRLNGTSDIPYEAFGILHEYPTLAKYDYTKGWARVEQWLNGRRRSDGFRDDGSGSFRGLKKYHLTLSLGGTLDARPDASAIYQRILDRGGTVAAVWATKSLVQAQIRDGVDAFLVSDQQGNIVRRIDLGKRRQVIDGDYEHGDLRFLDPPGVIVGLFAKGRTEHLDTSPDRFFLHNPGTSRELGMRSNRRAMVVSAVPMAGIKGGTGHISIDAR